MRRHREISQKIWKIVKLESARIGDAQRVENVAGGKIFADNRVRFFTQHIFHLYGPHRRPIGNAPEFDTVRQ